MNNQQYLDRPDKDGTKEAHPAWWRGHNTAFYNTLNVYKEIISGEDNGDGIKLNQDLEKTRRVFLSWKAFLEELSSKSTNYMAKHAKKLLKESKC